MSLSKNPNTYMHTKPVLDAAVENCGGTYTLVSNRAAMQWRAQAYMYRSLIGQSGPTNYDALSLTVVNNRVIFSIKGVLGEFTTEDGTIIKLDKTPPDAIDPLLDFAKTLVLEVGDLDLPEIEK